MILLFYGKIVLSVVFTILLIVNNFNLTALFAVLLGVIFYGWAMFCLFSFFKKKTEKSLYRFRKTLEYSPFVLVASFIISRISIPNLYVLDAILTYFWISLVIYNRVILYRLSEKRFKKYFPEISAIAKEKKHSVLYGVFDWGDAIIQAICTVFLFTLFVLQLYVIPSESMVPQFMVGDRVMGVKIGAGPALPLSSYRFPSFYNYKRGDIVIIRNPNYESDENNEINFFSSHIVQYLTFTLVNTNRDETGRMKADPLVKRIVGMPGEKLMLVDGVLYIKKAGEKDFKKYDESPYVAWNLEILPKSKLKYVQDIRMDTQTLNKLESVESLRSNVDFSKALEEADIIIDKMKKLKLNDEKVFSTNNFLTKGQYLINQMIKDNLIITSKILNDNGGVFWFESFLKDWSKQIEKISSYNLYETRNAQLNILIKLELGKLFVRNAELFLDNASDEKFNSDSQRRDILSELQNYLMYLMYSRSRNMNEFPKGEEKYIPDNCFFMMGDNRFNSTDMRHVYQFHLEELDSNDLNSILFITNVKPRYIHSSRMLGTVNLIIFPFSRFGKF